MEIRMVLFLPRDAASVPVSRQVLTGCLQTLGVTEDVRDDIGLALTEACANVIQHAGPGDEYEVLAAARDGRCVIEVVNTVERAATGPGPLTGAGLATGPGRLTGAGAGPGSVPAHQAPGAGPGSGQPGGNAREMPPPEAEHGRGLQIIDAVADDVRLTDDGRAGTTVHFEKILRWEPGATGQELFSAGS